MASEELSREAIKLIATADRKEVLVLTATLGAILESDGRLTDEFIANIKAEYSTEEFAEALAKIRTIKAIGQRDRDAVLCETCEETAAFILSRLIGAD